MKKILCLLFVFCLILTGCHGQYAPSNTAQTPVATPEEEPEALSYPVPDTLDSSRQFTVEFWTKNDSNSTQVAIYKQAIADFEALYPNIHIELRLYTDYGKIYSDVITNIATNTTPDVCATYPDHIATYLTGSDTVVPLDSFLDHEKYGLGGSALKFDSPSRQQLVPQFLAECKLNGSHYAIPYMRSTEACYVNKTFVERLGYTLPEVLTWDFVWEVSQAAMAQDSSGNYLVNGQKVMIPFLYKSTDNMMIQMLQQKGAGYSTPSGQILVFNDTTKELLRTIGSSAEIGAFNTFKTIGYPANYLNAGQCIFAVDSTAGATWMGTDAPLLDIPPENLVEFETVVMPVPQFDPDHMQMISQGPSLCVFQDEDPQQVLASWLFAQFMLTDRVQIDYSQTEGYLPVTNKAMETEEYQTYLQNRGIDNEKHYSIKLDAATLLMDNIDKTFVTAVFNGSASLRNAAGQMIEDVRKSAKRGESLDDGYMEKLFQKMASQYHLDQITAQDTQQQFSTPDMGPLPVEAVALLVCLGAAWFLIIIYTIIQRIQRKKI